MIYQNVSLKKIWQLCILILLTAAILSGCGQKDKQDYDMQLHMQSGIHFLQTTHNQINNRMQEIAVEIEKRNMPEIEAKDSIVTVKIHNAEEYQAFVGCLEEYTDYGVLWLDLLETDTVIYLDEILAYQNFEILRIECGGIITARNIENLKRNPLQDIDLYHAYAIEENMLSRMANLQYITIRLNSWYTGVLPANELLQNTANSNITNSNTTIIWDDDRKEEVSLEEYAEWNEITRRLSENIRYLKAIYVLNETDYSYISYEFCGEETEKECEAFICIKDRESQGEEYFDILEVPVESIDMSWLDVFVGRMRLMDINFDGYRDLIFLGYNDAIGMWRECIGFLWNEEKQRYELNTSVPKKFRGVDAERKRITHTVTSSLKDEYRIYEYNGSIFTEKRLEVISSLTEYYLITWQYYEDGKLLKRLEKNLDEDTKLYYIIYEENGIVTEKVMEKDDYENNYDSYMDLGKEYFPEFDFYWVG